MSTANPQLAQTMDLGEGYWQNVWRQLKKNRQGMVGFICILFLLCLATVCPLVANDRPIVCTYQGELHFPAMPSYVDMLVPWVGARNNMKSFELFGGYPFSDFYPQLEGSTWKEVADSEDMGFAIWPPIPWSPTQFNKDDGKLPPFTNGHILGTDDLGRDVLARLIHGTYVAWMVGVISMTIAASIGITLGLTAGYFGGWVDILLSRVVEIVICFPAFFLIIAVISFVPASIMNIMIVIGMIRWTGIFRLIRGEVLRVRNMDYIAAAMALGVRPRRIMWRHILPNAVSPVFVSIAFGIAGAVLVETSLSFLGFGDQTVPSWGEVVSQGRLYIAQGLWHLTIFPGLAIFFMLTAFNLFGQGLRDAMDPKLRR